MFWVWLALKSTLHLKRPPSLYWTDLMTSLAGDTAVWKTTLCGNYYYGCLDVIKARNTVVVGVIISMSCQEPSVVLISFPKPAGGSSDQWLEAAGRPSNLRGIS